MKPITHYWQNLNFVSLILAPVSFFFCFLVTVRFFFYRIGLLKISPSHLPVIVVGNIYIGGNGKTPAVIWLVEKLKQAGYKPGIVSRGYGAIDSDAHPWPRLVDLNKDLFLFGDEPFLIHQTTQCPVVVAPDRPLAVEKIAQETDCDVIISDDGLQHYAMARFIEINITDAKRLYGNGFCLPAGPLREKIKRLNSVDYIIYNISSKQPEKVIEPSANKTFYMDYSFSDLQPVSSDSKRNGIEQSMTLADFKGKIVHAVAGIGEPSQFFERLKQNGLEVIEHSFVDHYQYQQNDLVFNDSYPIIMTEKDAVKCQGFSLPDCWYVPIKAKIDDKLINQIIEKLKTYKVHF